MKRAVIDASVAVKWVVLEPGSDTALMLLTSGTTLLAPSHWIGEVTTTLWAKVTKHLELTEDEADRRLRFLLDLNVVETPARSLAQIAFGCALELGITGYDALYLALAQREDVSVITADRIFVKRVRASTRYAAFIMPLTELPSWLGS